MDLTSEAASSANTQATQAASSKERPRCKEKKAIVQLAAVREGLKGIGCMGPQIID